ncbi:adenylate/guanylate cyclase domain-containing protein [Candidatus Gracilibacteria bacterium]|nr:adenylate/guanylate cyclase domain-containing protein [bacterium]NDK19573.1 adenylate/guanylate cyclase domain-containing protein [Candidatus Gracilibacteria bacterium]
MKLSIYSTNYVIISLFAGSNTLFIISLIKIPSGYITSYIALFAILLNASLILIYLLLNKKYRKDHANLIENFRLTLTEEDSRNFKSRIHFFHENKEMETILKKSYIKKNILKKDLGDLHKVFKKFISHDIFKEIGFKGYEKITLGGVCEKNLNVMFLDIIGFTNISEQITPERALLLLNIYFDGIGEIIYDHNGYIDKFLGDGIMIIFEQDISDNALTCALEIQKFMKRFQVSSIGKEINIGIGINTGNVIVGTIGTKHRMEATIIGDTVNTASRLESLTRKYDRKIILSQSVVDKVQDLGKFSIDKLDTIVLKGKQQSTQIFALNVD